MLYNAFKSNMGYWASIIILVIVVLLSIIELVESESKVKALEDKISETQNKVESCQYTLKNAYRRIPIMELPKYDM